MIYGLIGEKLSHSFSPMIHHALADYEYILMEIGIEDIDEFMTKREFTAVNVTIPYKQTVIPYLHYIDEAAKEIGAVNTIVNNNGLLYGYNTDYYGLVALMERNNICVKGKKVLILGSGGTSKTAKVAVKNMGAREIYRISRTGKEDCITYEDAIQNHSDADIIINTTPAGMFPDVLSQAVDLKYFKNLSGVVDVVYNPLDTKLIIQAKSMGIPATGGLYMLVAQAAKASEYFIGRKPEDNDVEKVYNDLLSDKENIVLIGMPSSGKTSVSEALSKMTGKDILDTDELIVRKAGIPITEIFAKYGEEYFRDMESDIVRAVSMMQGKIISTGGGVVLRKENIDVLRQNGIIFFLDRPLEKLIATTDRPLSSTREDLTKRYNERYEIYRSAADIIINVPDGVENTAKEVLKKWKS